GPGHAPRGQPRRRSGLGQAGARLCGAGRYGQARCGAEIRSPTLCRKTRHTRAVERGRRRGSDEMSWLPKSPKARRRLTLLLAIAPVLALAAGLTLWGLRDSISFFYTPSQAAQANPPAGRAIQLGGLVKVGSVRKASDGRVSFVVADRTAQDQV